MLGMIMKMLPKDVDKKLEEIIKTSLTEIECPTHLKPGYLIIEKESTVYLCHINYNPQTDKVEKIVKISKFGEFIKELLSKMG
ncbi:MAG: hypothetical protein WC389_12355 [Lutibacter sp.]|jgi:hypothetical protein